MKTTTCRNLSKVIELGVAIRNLDINVMRNLIIDDFELECLPISNLVDVAIVGGSLMDPEVSLIKEKYPNARFEVYGIEDSQIFMDLNASPTIMKHFDLVLCTNVIEHVFNHENFAKNIILLLRPGGVAWCCFPFSDMYHSSPGFYSSGFHPDYVINLFERNGGVGIKSGIHSSKRAYLFTHLLKEWPSEFRYDHPLIGQIVWSLGLRNNSRPPIKNLSPHRLLICLYLTFIPKAFDENPNYGCVSWVKIVRNKTFEE